LNIEKGVREYKASKDVSDPESDNELVGTGPSRTQVGRVALEYKANIQDPR
jgi:hypothetical protein